LAPQFYPLRIRDISRTTADCSVLSFDVPENLREAFAFKQGQHLTLKTQVNGEEIRRSYSLCSSPLDKEWKVAVKKIDGGAFSGFVNEQLKPGDVLDVMNPHGSFFVEPEPGAEKHYVAFAAGSGITPIFSILKTHLQAEPKARFSLFYTNQNVASIILKEEIEALKNQYIDRFEPYFFLTQEERDVSLFNGRMDDEKLEKIFRYFLDLPSVDHFFLCGPEELIFKIRDSLISHGVDLKRIHFELFTTQAGQNRIRKSKPDSKSAGTTDVMIREGGKNMKFRMAKDSETILEAALRYNAGLPFACKGGVCCTCKAKLLEGKVEMEVNYALEKEQLDAGYILTCQAVPLTDTVVVDFDQ
jgi:ring-1,2-phenylacetyl-CoA epoxidase subunit PaaE